MESQIDKIESSNLKAFSSGESFELALRISTMLSKSDLVPQNFKGNIANCTIALNMANRIGADPLMVMQHLYIVHGKPSWSSTFLIAAINNCGRFNPLRYEITGDNDQKGCIAWTTEKNSTERLESPRVTIEMAKKEGWFQKAGSKWQTMPDLMMRYRAAALFSRLYCPEITMGMHTYEEVQDAEVIDSRLPKKSGKEKKEDLKDKRKSLEQSKKVDLP